MNNHVLSGLFERMADLMEVRGEPVFKVNAYRRASRAIDSLQLDVAQLREEKTLRNVPGIGESTAARIEEYLDTGKIQRFEELKRGGWEGAVELLQLGGLGPRTVAMLRKEAGVKNVTDLKAALDSGKLEGLAGLGEKKLENLRKSLEFRAREPGRAPLGVAWVAAQELLEALKKIAPRTLLSTAGSLRRMRETIGDVDLLCGTATPQKVLDAFVKLPQVEEVMAHGDTKASVRVAGGLQVDLRAVERDSFGAALQYFTGSKEHNVRLRERARRLGLKVNEYGVYRGEEKIAGETEEGVYEALGLAWMPPEMREDRGELELAESGRLPKLVELPDIHGDLHCHTRESDGDLTIEELAAAALERGYQYAAVTDHSPSAAYAGGLSVERLLDHIAAVRAFNRKQSKIHLLAGTESDIRSDGSLDYPDEVLAKLDWVVASIHGAFTRDPTGRLVKALEHPATSVLGHPSGRLILQREGYAVEWERVFKAAVEHGKAIEINAHYSRLDLDDVRARRAADLGIPIVINTDMHRADNFDQMRFGVGVARRAWLTKEQVVNTRTWSRFESWWKKAREGRAGD